MTFLDLFRLPMHRRSALEELKKSKMLAEARLLTQRCVAP